MSSRFPFRGNERDPLTKPILSIKRERWLSTHAALRFDLALLALQDGQINLTN
jgi:hypothetical protein